MKRPRYISLPHGDGRWYVLDRVNRGISELYAWDDARDLAAWLNWRDTGYSL